ncbi:hypothetical protein DL764_009468 [Monosporascus ibericus]|uniref:N-acetyltransferase domain-containing protein n=1 Tax=Monosporascus ibericus TaxID=155417 RepID=A0A4Q4SX71_9PEZI|nr:hypothetical protein DL764_009468 [Monosporascus ibericus]
MKRQKWVDTPETWKELEKILQAQGDADSTLPKLPTSNEVSNKEMSTGPNIQAKDEWGVFPMAESSLIYDGPSESQNWSIQSSSGNVPLTKTEETCDPHLKGMNEPESLRNEACSESKKDQTKFTPDGVQQKPGGLQDSQWAKEVAKESRSPYLTPTKTIKRPQATAISIIPFNERNNASRPYMPPPMRSQPGSAKQNAIDTASRQVTPGVRINPVFLARVQAEVARTAEEAARAEANRGAVDEKLKQIIGQTEVQHLYKRGADDQARAINTNDEAQENREAEQRVRTKRAEEEAGAKQVAEDKLEATAQTPEIEQEPPGKEAVDEEKVKVKAQEDALTTTQADPRQYPSLTRVLSPEHETNRLTASENPLKNDSTPLPLTAEAMLTKFGSCPKDRSESGDPMSQVSATGIEKPSKPARWAPRDIRGETPVELWTEQDWNETRRPKPKKPWEEDSIHSDMHIIISGSLKRFVEWWADAIPETKADFLERDIPGHQYRDVDTNTGTLIEPVEYPDTFRPPGSVRVQFDLTPQEYINSVLHELQVRADRIAQKKSKRETAATKAARQRAIEEDVNPDEVQVDCHIRPATEQDMEGVAAVYNREVNNSYKVVDTQPVTVAKFHELLRGCKAQSQPFVVAVADWHFAGMEKSENSIIGFCLVDALERGISGSHNTSTKPCGKILVVVHPDWRQKKLGTALIDVVMASCSTRYTSRQGYQWVSTPDDQVHVRPSYNKRRWHMLQIEILVRSGKSKEDVQRGEEYKWILEFLEVKFALLLTKHDEKLYYHPSQALGLNHWLDRLTFEHRCRDWNG